MINNINEQLGQKLTEKDYDSLQSSLNQTALVSMTDAMGNIVYANEKFVEVSKYNLDELLGQNHRILKSGTQPQELFVDLWKTISNGKVWRGEIKNKAKDGTYYWVDTSIAPILNSLGKPERYISVRILISDKKKLEEETTLKLVELEDTKKAMLSVLEDLGIEKEKTKEEKAKDEAILASIDDGLVTVDEEGKIIYINKSFENILGWKAPEVIGKNMFEIIPRVDISGNAIPYKERSAQVFSGHKTIADLNNPFYFVRKDKGRFPVSVIITPVVIDGKIIGAVEMFRDITQEKAIEEIKKEQLVEEIKLEHQEKDFISMASHQLLTPLALTKGYISMLVSGKLGKIDGEARKYLEESLQGSQRMSNLVESLLTTSRIESGNIKIVGSNFDLDELTRDVADELKPKLDDKKLELDLPTPRQLMVFADRDQTREVLMNVLDNAIKYTETGTITITESKTDSMGIVSVKDSGIGINQKDLPHIFEKFYSSENWLRTQSESHGLGLYIAELLLKLMNGSIKAESKSGVGSTFNIALPLPKNV